MRILGIDPGTGRIGWAVIDKKGQVETLLASGCLEIVPKTALPERLETIFLFFNSLIEEYKPDTAAVEDLFFSRNVSTAISVASSRGVVLLSLKLAGVSSHSYTPSQIKLAVTGYGSADKKQVEQMVLRILKTKEVVRLDDTADAMAVALTHSAVTKPGVESN